MDQYLGQLLIVFGLVLLNAFFAGAEIAVLSSKPVRARQLAEEGSHGAQALLRLLDDHSRFLATIQVGVTLAGFLASASAAVSLSDDLGGLLRSWGLPKAMAESMAVVLVTLGVSYFTLVIGELVPKRLALQAPERIATLVARPVELLSKLAGPFTALLTKSTNLVVQMMGVKVEQPDRGLTEEELLLYVEEHKDLHTEEKKLIAGVFDFGDRVVRQLMVPRTEMVCLRQDLVLSQVLAEVREAGFWSFPVYGESYDDIVGVVTVKDLLQHLTDPADDPPVSALMRPVEFVPESKRALELLKEMQQRDLKMVMVVDEYGGVAGLVTLEDLLQEIVGDVVEDVELSTRSQDVKETVLDGSYTVEEVEDYLNVDLPESSHYETLAGFILHALGSVPKEGDAVAIRGWQLVVHRMDGHRVDKVRAVPQAKGGETEG
jgi:putative hemolysin